MLMASHDPPIDEPFDTLTRHMGQMMDELAARQFFNFSAHDSWEPVVNVYVTAAAYFVCVDLAGMDGEAIDVREDGGQLVIRGRRATPTPPDAEGPLSVDRMEIDSGPFRRTVELPADVDRSAIRARYRAGMLWVTLPRVGGARSEKSDECSATGESAG